MKSQELSLPYTELGLWFITYMALLSAHATGETKEFLYAWQTKFWPELNAWPLYMFRLCLGGLCLPLLVFVILNLVYPQAYGLKGAPVGCPVCWISIV